VGPNFAAAAYIFRNQTAADNRDQSLRKTYRGWITGFHELSAQVRKKHLTDDAPAI
jgi:hypothetical protein